MFITALHCLAVVLLVGAGLKVLGRMGLRFPKFGGSSRSSRPGLPTSEDPVLNALLVGVRADAGNATSYRERSAESTWNLILDSYSVDDPAVVQQIHWTMANDTATVRMAVTRMLGDKARLAERGGEQFSPHSTIQAIPRPSLGWTRDTNKGLD